MWDIGVFGMVYGYAWIVPIWVCRGFVVDNEYHYRLLLKVTFMFNRWVVFIT